MFLKIEHYISTIEKGVEKITSYILPDSITAIDQDITLGKKNYWIIITTRKGYIIDETQLKKTIDILEIMEKKKEPSNKQNYLG
jgi:hypothetical protein